MGNIVNIIMGNNTSLPDNEAPGSRPGGLKQLNDSVWELHCPKGVPEAEVIFFHGLQLFDYKEAFWKTWLSRDNTVLWPRAWLGPALPNARISSVSYYSSARPTECTGVAEMYQIIENLMQDVVLSQNFAIDENSKVVLVGHSIGGLIIKQLLLKCLEESGKLDSRIPAEASLEKRLTTFLSNCTGIFYYSTPHAGSKVAVYADLANGIPGADTRNTPTINFLRDLSCDTARINNDFIKVRKGILNVATHAIGELYDTPFAGLSKRVVPEASARYDVDQYYSTPANHFEVCKPENNSFSNIFIDLRDFCATYATADHEAALDLPDLPTYTPLSTVPAAHARSQPASEAPLPALPSYRP